ncbi:hypothetical protein LCGC14_0832520 [marine sediment metagenome]|uniref:Uncharacterized protein n=1 Tax=marine sediment metagenome TaxID=412755 RepID=A0A0F9SMS6_9ZZZZ
MAREDYITDTDIRDLQIEANNAGDLDQVAICMVALGEDCSDEGDDEHYPIAKPATTPPKCALTREDARAECARVIEDAEARAELCESDVVQS